MSSLTLSFLYSALPYGNYYMTKHQFIRVLCLYLYFYFIIGQY